MKTPFLIYALASIALHASPAFAGPPFITDDPEPVEYRHWEVYLASQSFHDQTGWAATAPHVEVNEGALPNLQLHIIAPLVLSVPVNGSSHFGYGDTEVGAKYRFIDETSSRPQVGSFPLVEIPTGDSGLGLGYGAFQFFLPVWVQKSFGRWLMYGGGGYWFTTGNPSQSWWFLGYTLQRQILDKLALGAEIFYLSPKDQFTASETRFNIGMTLDFSEMSHLLLSMGRGLQGGNLFQSYVAYQLTVGP